MERLTERIDNVPDGESGVWVKQHDYISAAEKLADYEDAEEQGRYGKWIPVSERLPEESLNSVIGWDTYRNRCCFVQYLGGRFVLGDDIYSVNVTAWMPLPEPYRVGAENAHTKKIQTNADRIRSFSDEELAEFIEQVSTDSMETISFGTKEYEEIWEHKETALQWLQSEVEE